MSIDSIKYINQLVYCIEIVVSIGLVIHSSSLADTEIQIFGMQY